MKNSVFWDVAPCRYFVNRRFGGTYRLHLQGIRKPQAMNQLEQVAVYSYKISTRRHIPEDGILMLFLLFSFVCLTLSTKRVNATDRPRHSLSG
jgi:hypothetical protein